MSLGTSSNIKRLGVWGMMALVLTLAATTAQPASARTNSSCSLATLTGLYVFDSTGYNIVDSVPQPKAVVEFMQMKGDGTLTSLATVSIDGVIHQGIQGSGTYTINSDCSGSLTFDSGPHFDIFVAPSGKVFHMIQTDPDTVLAGLSRRLSK